MDFMKTERVYLRYDLDINDTRRYVNRVYLHSVVQAEEEQMQALLQSQR